MNIPLFPHVAPQLATHGYRPVPITPGTKAPTRLPQWQKYEYDSVDDARFADCGTGILTGEVVGVDIDIPDAEVVKGLLTWLLATYGVAPVRFGNKPKALALYRAAQPAMTKKQTRVFNRGKLKGKVEVLSRGQQFVAYAVHPDTKQPYEWYGGNPLTVPVDKLPVINDAQVSEIIEQCATRLALWGNLPAPAAPASPRQLDPALFPPRDMVVAENDALSIQRQPATRTELIRLLAVLAEFDQGDYDSWREVGQIIHHETGGSNEGLEIFIQYSRCLTGFYAGAEAGEEGCRAKWRSFGRSSTRPVTFGTLVHRLSALRATRRLGVGPARGTGEPAPREVRELGKPDGASHY